jgi:hypothetical protein
MHPKVTKTLLAAAIATAITPVGATTYQVYNPTDPAGFSGNGDELAAALLSLNSGITIDPASAQFQGNFGEGGFDEVEVEFDEGPIPNDVVLDNDFANEDFGSAAIFTGLNFGSVGGTDFVLPDGILLTSGSADLNHNTNSESGFSHTASGLGDQGLQDLLDAHFGDGGDDEGYGGEGGANISSDATVLAFDFTVDEGIEAVSLDFLFGSEEFPEFVDSFPEIAGIFIDGVNYAVLSDGNPLTLTGQTVDGANFFDNDFQDGTAPLAVEYDGITRPLTLTGLLDQSLDTHSIKIAVSDTNDTVLDTGLFVANLQGLPGVPGINPNDPIMPDTPQPGDEGFTFTIDVGDSGVGIDPLFPIFIDPDVAVGYVYEVTGTTFGSVTLPMLGFGDDLFDIYGWDGTDFVLLTSDWLAGDAFLFGGSGVSKFKVEGIELEGALDPTDPLAFVTGITFTSGGTGITVTQTPIVESTAVPEPATLGLMLIGLLGMGRARILVLRKQR